MNILQRNCDYSEAKIEKRFEQKISSHKHCNLVGILGTIGHKTYYSHAEQDLILLVLLGTIDHMINCN